jgi:hypothetical protein
VPKFTLPDFFDNKAHVPKPKPDKRKLKSVIVKRNDVKVEDLDTARTNDTPFSAVNIPLSPKVEIADTEPEPLPPKVTVISEAEFIKHFSLLKGETVPLALVKEYWK